MTDWGKKHNTHWEKAQGEHRKQRCRCCRRLAYFDILEYGLCPGCLKERKTATPMDANSYIVISSPDPTIREGARFGITEMREGLKMGIWPAGMLVRRRQRGHKEYRIVECEKQRLEAI